MPLKTISTKLTSKAALYRAVFELKKANIDSAWLDSELLLAFVLKTSRSDILAHDEKTLTTIQARRFFTLIRQRAKQYPLAYLVGHKEFYGLDFIVTKDTLVPRPESELLVEEALKHTDAKTTIVDIGTGSGCLISSVLKHSKANGYALDISSKALTVAKKSATRHGLRARIIFKKSDLLSGFNANLKTKLVILANLPYLTPSQMKEPSIKHEPKSALIAGRDGLLYYRKLAKQLKRFSNYTLLCEINPGQKVGFKKLFPTAEFKKDLSGKVRVGIVAM